MTAASPATPEPASAPRLAEIFAARPLWLALAVTALVTVCRMSGTVDSDVAWQLWIAGRIHAGAHLYTDIVEVNPPLWFWMALPIDSLASLLHVRIEAVLVAAVGTLVGLALIATDRLVSHIPSQRRGWLLGYAALCLLGMPWAHVGQREQLVLIGSLPYAALIAARRQGDSVPWLLAALVGAGAGLGFALKHYFLLVPALLELWLLLVKRRDWRLPRPEIVAMAAVGVAYGAAILLAAPEFLTSIVPLVRLSYGELGAPSLSFLFGPFVLLAISCLAFVAFQMRAPWSRSAPLTSALFVTGLGFGAIYFLQAKGWLYHAIPLLGCASLALAALVAETATPKFSLRIFAPALLALPLFLAVQEQRKAINPSPELQNAVAGLHEGDSVGFLAVETAIPWSITLQRGFRYPSRYMGFWMLNAVVPNDYRAQPDPRLSELGRRVVSETVDDFLCLPPKRIIVPRPLPGDSGFDILPFFLRNKDFAALLSHYRMSSRTGIATYELVTPLPAPHRPCRHGA